MNCNTHDLSLVKETRNQKDKILYILQLQLSTLFVVLHKFYQNIVHICHLQDNTVLDNMDKKSNIIA